MRQYIGWEDAENPEIALIYAKNEEHALELYLRHRVNLNKYFNETLSDRSPNMGFPEYIIPFSEWGNDDWADSFRQRVHIFFANNTQWAEQYLDFYFSDKDEHGFDEDMKYYIMSKIYKDWFEKIVIQPLSELPKLR